MKKMKMENGDDSGGDTSFESLMEDTPSNYNIPNQRFEHNYYEVDEILEERKEEEKYDEQGKSILKKKRKLKKKKKRKPEPVDQKLSERELLMSRAYGENNNRGTTTHKTSEKALPLTSNKKPMRKEN